MKTTLLWLFLLHAALPSAYAGEVRFPLAPIPYSVALPEDEADRLTAGPLAGSFAAEVKAAGAAEAVVVRYRPEAGEDVILFSAFYVPVAAWAADQSPDHPALFGREVVRTAEMVLGIAGPFDTIFDPATADGRRVIALAQRITQPERFSPAE